MPVVLGPLPPRRLAVGLGLLWLFVGATTLPAQSSATDAAPLFAAADVLPVTVRADFTALRDDRRESPNRTARLWVGPGSEAAEIGARIRTRGAFRLDPVNCSFPPLRWDVDGSDSRGTVFDGQDELKFVSACRPGHARYEELVIKEYLAYRTYALLTDRSFQVRLLRVTLIDDADPVSYVPSDGVELGEGETRMAFLIEDDEELAGRLGASVFDLPDGKNLPVSAFDGRSLLFSALFLYMIGSTDWSSVAGHNVEILDQKGVAVAVPYDFDMSGLIDPPYATSNPTFGLSSVRERYYRGWCANPLETAAALSTFRDARGAIMALWRNEAGLSDETRADAIGYLQAFFDDVETDDRAQRRFLRDCRTPAG